MKTSINDYGDIIAILQKKLFSAAERLSAPLDVSIMGPHIISGIAGSGKTQMIVELCCTGIRDSQAKPVIIVPNRTAKCNVEKILSSAWEQGTSRELDKNFSAVAVDHKLVQTPHSFAYSIVERAAALKLLAMPTLLSAYEFDAILTDILQGQLLTGESPWLDDMTTAVRNPEFIPLLRDFLLRAGENFISPEQMQRMAQVYQSPMWKSIAATMAEYQAINALQAAHDFSDQSVGQSGLLLSVSNSAELMEIAVRLLLSEDELLTSLQHSYTHIFVDDAHSFTPDSGYLFQALTRFIPHMILTLDRSLAPFSWRGADRNFIDQFTQATEYTLQTSFRVPEPIAEFANHISLSGMLHSQNNIGQIGMTACTSREMSTSTLVEALLFAHENQAIPWEDIAIIARDGRSFTRQLLQRLQQEHIPYIHELSPPTLSDSTVINACNAVLALYSGNFCIENVQTFLLSPLCGINGAIAQRIAVLIYRWKISEKDDTEQKLQQLKHEIDLLAEREISSEAVRAIQIFLRGYERDISHASQIIHHLQNLWDHARAHNPIFSTPLRFPQINEQIHREIYAVEIYWEHLIRHYLGSTAPLNYIFQAWEHLFATNIGKIVIPVSENAITLTSAHASAGREWKYVIIVGLEENIWPNPRIRTDILDTQKFLLCCQLQMNEPNPQVNMFDINMRDERNLLLLALTRASWRIDIITIDNPHGPDPQRPSEFFSLLRHCAAQKSHICGLIMQADEKSANQKQLTSYARETNTYILQLRAQLDSEHPVEVQHAITMLAYLQKYNIMAAHPRNWYNFLAPSSIDSIYPSDTPVILYPSRIDSLATCPTGWFLASLIHTSTSAMVNGIIIHAAAEACAHGTPLSEVITSLDKVLREYLTEPEFLKQMRIKRILHIIERIQQTFLARVSSHDLIAVEQSKRIHIADIAEHAVYLSGRLDRIERRKSDNMPVVVDIKTGKNPLSVHEAQHNLQMLAYRRMIDPLYQSMAQLYYPATNSKKPTFRDQLPVEMSEEAIDDFARESDKIFAHIASLAMGPDFMINSDPQHICAQGKICSYLRERL